MLISPTTGPTLLKPELYKEIGKSTFCTEVMANLYDNQFYSEEVPESWKESKTKLIAKKKKPTVKDFRPIALTNISYKLFMSLIKNQIEEHLTENNLVKYCLNTTKQVLQKEEEWKIIYLFYSI